MPIYKLVFVLLTKYMPRIQILMFDEFYVIFQLILLIKSFVICDFKSNTVHVHFRSFKVVRYKKNPP